MFSESHNNIDALYAFLMSPLRKHLSIMKVRMIKKKPQNKKTLNLPTYHCSSVKWPGLEPRQFDLSYLALYLT